MFINGACPFCLKAEENINHILRNFDFATNLWCIIDNNCPNPLNTNIDIIDRLEYLWLNNFGLKKV